MRRAAALQRFLGRPWVETTLGGLIIASAALTVIETTSRHAEPRASSTRVHAISAVFVLELFARFRIAPSRRGFFKEYWLDILSVLPLLAALRLPFVEGASAVPPGWLAALALLRIFRLLRLLKIARHRVLLFPRVLRKGAREVFFASGLVLLAVVFASSALVMFERETNPALAHVSAGLLVQRLLGDRHRADPRPAAHVRRPCRGGLRHLDGAVHFRHRRRNDLCSRLRSHALR